jgi:tetratricopeptide (TPR) repeat protein
MLFDRANRAVRERRCADALPDYERLVREFSDNHRVPASQYNRGLCLDRLSRHEEAVAALRIATRAEHDPELVRDAWFRVAVIGETAQRPPWVLEATDAILARARLDLTDRVEALARRASALLAQGERDAAERAAQQAIELAPTPEAIAALGDDTYAAQARVVFAEITRLRADAVAYAIEAPDAADAITRKVTLVTHAHALYNDAIRAGNPHWAAAAGFRIGEMYSSLYEAIVHAPTPADWDDAARALYRRRTGERLRPLLQGALRSWEATLSMARRNGISDNDWVRRADEALVRLRALITGEPTAPPTRPGGSNAGPAV